MKVLILSHNCISRTSNMGKTLFSYFRDFSPEELAQFYIHCEEPMEPLCRNYHRFTDLDALVSLFSSRSCGRRFSQEDIHPERISARTDRGLLRSVYRLGARRTAFVFALRNLLWRCSRWDSEAFWNWIEDFGPDVIFLASGDYGFLYEIACRVADYTGKPLAVCCVDDFYLHNRNDSSLLGKLVHRQFLKTVHKTMNRAAEIFTICDSLAQAHTGLFSRPCRVLHTPALPGMEDTWSEEQISYLGNLELGRPEQLVAIGSALQTLSLPGIPQFLDVYSAEQDPKILKIMTLENGIRFHGAVSAEEMLQIMHRSMAVIHTESFDPKMQAITRYSISAKIPDSLRNGPCIIAYGPKGVASMDYLEEHGAAWCIHSAAELSKCLEEILTDTSLRNRIIINARRLASENHGSDAGSRLLRRCLDMICGDRNESNTT